MYKVDLSAKAQKFYGKADLPLARKLARCFEQLEQDPRQHSNIKQLKGGLAGCYRYRVGDYRVIYRIDDAQQLVAVLKIAHRSEAYE
jgi:mRNA interferase RelE/StbE